MTDSSFSEFMKTTRPGPPQQRCDSCQTASLRTRTNPVTQEDEVICTNIRCSASPLHREE
jgi:hypothetical protein